MVGVEEVLIELGDNHECEEVHNNFYDVVDGKQYCHVDKLNTHKHQHLEEPHEEGLEPRVELPVMVHCILHHLEGPFSFIVEGNMQDNRAEKSTQNSGHWASRFSIELHHLIVLECILNQHPDQHQLADGKESKLGDQVIAFSLEAIQPIGVFAGRILLFFFL